MQIKKILVVVLCILLLGLTGCGYITGSTQEQVEEYNNQVLETIEVYESGRKMAEDHKEELYSYIRGEAPNILGKEFEGVGSQEGIEDFMHGSILRDEYFISNGSKVLREVVVLYGPRKVYIEVLWSSTGVHSITRRYV